MNIKNVLWMVLLLLVSSTSAQTVAVEGTKQRWHKVTLKLTGPSSSEQNSNNPFLNYRFDVTFSHPASGTSYKVPGYFATDGNAGNSGATSGNKWKAHLSPDHTGTWNYAISFRQGNNVAVGASGSALSPYNGLSGSFNISESNKSGRDFRAKTNGRLKYVGQRYLKFSGSNKYFLKQGPDAPENMLNYADFDGMFSNSRLKTWSAHLGDWKSGDPTWKNGKGKALIGAVNYLASEGMNAFSFLTMNIGGDDNNAYPYVVKNNTTGSHPNTSKIVYANTLKTVMDCSKLDQWEVLFGHATSKGMYLHFKTQETENDQYLDGGNLGTERKLYYRELIARFGHNLALNWNLGEETTNSTSQLKSFAQYFYDNDPYRHNVVLHTYPGDKDKRYGPLLGSASKLTGLSMQTSNAAFGQEHGDVLKWVKASEDSGRPWIVAVDEPGDAGKALRPDNDAGNSHEDGRKRALWGTFMAGGAGNEWYFGYQHAHSDLTCEDFRSRNKWWDYCRHALNFFNGNNVPFVSMSNQNGLIGNGSNNNDNGYCFAKASSNYVIYLPNGGSKNLNLNGVSGSYSVKWYDPRNGGSLKNGSVTSINGNGNRSIGNAPNNTGKDWLVYVVNKDLQGITEENDGYVVLEAEDTTMTGKWVRKTSAEVQGTGNFTGNGYIRFTGNSEVSGPANDILTYKIKINNPGNYKLVIRGLEAPIETGEGDKANDCYVRMVGQLGDFGTFKKHVLLGNSYQWSFNIKAEFTTHTFSQPIYNLTAGIHEFQIAGRSKNFHIDRVVLYKDLTDAQAKELSLENSDPNPNPNPDPNPDPDPNPNPDPDPNPENVYNATTDFSNITAGTVPYYKDNNNNALAIDASNTNYRNKFAQAEATFGGENGTYSVKITTLTEEDGESTYRLHVNGSIVKTYKNPYIGPGSPKDMGANTHTWTGAALNNGDKVAISSNTHSNGEIGEGSGTAWSRGRWRSIEFIKVAILPTTAIPGRIQAEDYNAYTDTTSGNSGGAYRNNNVDIEVTGDTGGGFNVGWVASGETLSYNVNIAEAGTYEATFRVASQQTGNKTLHIEIDGQNVSGPVTFNTNGNGWQSFQNVSAEVYLPAGNHVLKVVMDSSSFNLNYIDFELVEGSIPDGQTVSDIGNTAFGTLVTHDNGTYLISASGSDIWSSSDAFGFIHQNASGDVEVTARIESIENTNVWAKAGVMIRESLAAGSKHAMTVITPSKGASFQRRTATDAISGHTTLQGIKAPEFVRVLRTGNKFTGYYSSDKSVWFPMDTVNVSMNANVKVGLAVTSHDNSKETEAMISNFTVRNPSGNLAVTRFFLVNADTNQDIREIHHNETINLATDGANLSIRAETSGAEGSVVIDLDGTTQTESVVPYALKGDTAGNYAVWSPTAASYAIMATPYAEPSGVGAAGDSLAIIVNVVNN